MITATAFRQRFPHLMIRASAGTGKTFQLSNRYIGLLAADVPVEQMLAVTFTRKAAGEILDRVLLRLAEAAADRDAAAVLAGHICDDSLTQERCRELLRQATRSLHRMHIGTLDSFFSKLAGSFTLELSLPPGWRIIDELQDRRLQDDAIDVVLHQESLAALRTLTHELTKGETPRGISEVIRETVRSMYSLYLEAEEEAWHRLPRPKHLSDEEIRGLVRELRLIDLSGAKSLARARDEACEMAEQGKWDDFIAKGLGLAILEKRPNFSRQEIPEEVARLVHRLLGEAKAHFVTARANQTEAAYDLLKKFSDAYDQLKQERRAARFDDITRHLADFAKSAEPRRLAHRLDGSITHLLLDEFQDTSLPQWQVLRPLALRATTGLARSSFFCVGDGKQAIYAWRGGVAEILDALVEELPGLSDTTIATSYRSAQPIMETVNQVFARMTEHPSLDKCQAAVEKNARRFPQHTTARSDLPGYAAIEVAPAPTEDQKPYDAALTFAARRVAELVEQAPGHSVGVLVRRNQAVARLIYELHELGIHASEEGGNPLTDSAPVEIVLSLLRLADHPGDLISRFHVAASPVGPALGMAAHDDDLAAAQFAAALRRDLLEDGYGPTVRRWASLLAPHCNQREQTRLRQLVELAYQYPHAGTLRTADFVALIEHQRVADPTAADVRVMTIHQCKGLEFDIVVLPELGQNLRGQSPSFVVGRKSPAHPADKICHYMNEKERRLLPGDFQRLFDQDIERAVTESLCVLYVALTRAVHALHMIVSPTSGKCVPKTYEGLLQAALCDAAPFESGTVPFQIGDPQWHAALRSPGASPGKAARRKKPSAAPGQGELSFGESQMQVMQFDSLEPPQAIRLAPAPEGRRRGRELASPTSLMGGSQVRLDDVFGRSPTAMRRGELLHAFFAQVGWLDEGAPDRRQLTSLAKRMGPGELSLEKLLDDFYRMLDAPAIRRALSRSRHDQAAGVELYNERPFAVLEDDRLLRGYIDRLTVFTDRRGRVSGAEIIDYKTDSIRQGDQAALEERIAFYRPQLAAYHRAVCEMLGLEPAQVAVRVLFVGPGIEYEM